MTILSLIIILVVQSLSSIIVAAEVSFPPNEDSNIYWLDNDTEVSEVHLNSEESYPIQLVDLNKSDENIEIILPDTVNLDQERTDQNNTNKSVKYENKNSKVSITFGEESDNKVILFLRSVTVENEYKNTIYAKITRNDGTEYKSKPLTIINDYKASNENSSNSSENMESQDTDGSTNTESSEQTETTLKSSSEKETTSLKDSSKESCETDESEDSSVASKAVTSRTTNAEPGSLVISEDIFNSVDDIKNSIKISGTDDYKIKAVERGSGRSAYDDTDENKSTVYSNYLRKSGKVNISFNKKISEKKLSKVEIEYTYDNIGSIVTKNGDITEIGANIKISNIDKSLGGGWDDDGYPEKSPIIDLSNNMFSGVVTAGINSADWDIQFFDKETGEPIDFSSGEYLNPFLTFSSLNGYQKKNKGDYIYSEFVRPKNGTEGYTTGKSIVEFGTVKVIDGTKKHYEDVYYGADDFPESIDKLGNSKFPNASVSFDLKGTENGFQIGTGGGDYAFMWFTFASSSIIASRQKAPAKTVEPLNQFQAGDTWNSPSGDEVGFNERFYNDLDRYKDGGGPWDLNEKYRVEGHNADLPDRLLPGIPKKEDRYVSDGQEYYYFINQKVINLVSQSQVLPDGYEILDSLPPGMELSDKNDLSRNFTLFNLDGSQIKNPFTKNSVSQMTKNKFDLTLADHATELINDLSQDEDYYDSDFSLRVKVKVNNTSKDEIDDLMTNTASTKFIYEDVEDGGYTVDSNKVQTRVAPTYNFIKEDTEGNTLHGAEFELYHSDESGNKIGSVISTTTSREDGSFDFNNIILKPGYYLLSETKAPEGFKQKDFKFKVTDDAKIIGLNQDSEGNYIAINDAVIKKMSIKVFKQDEHSKEHLNGAVFDLYTKAETGNIDLISSKTTENDGSIEWTDLDISKVYYVKESKAPDGYILSEDEYKITFDNNSKKWKVEKENETVANGSSSEDEIDIIFKIDNKAKVPLPETGGNGVLSFILIGFISIIIAAFYFINPKKKRILFFGIGSLFLCLSGTINTNFVYAIENEDVVIINLHKLVFKQDTLPEMIPNTGLPIEGNNPILENSEVLSGVEFTAYDVTDEFYDLRFQGLTVEEAQRKLAASDSKSKNKITSQITDSNGLARFKLDSKTNDNKFKAYLFEETKTPSNILKGHNLVVVLPIYVKNQLLSTIDLYPKNEYVDIPLSKRIDSDSNDFAYGQKINYHIETIIPKDIETYDHYYLEDKADASLEYLKETFKISIAGLTDQKFYERPIFSNEENAFRINFDPNKLSEHVGKKIEIDYQMIIKGNAEPDTDFTNEVTLHPGPHDSITKDQNVMTGGKRFIKIDSTNNAIHLSGAEFLVKNDNQMYLVKDVHGFSWTKNKTANNIFKLTSDKNGQFTIKGMQFGRYELQEIHAPDGYMLSTTEIPFEISRGSYLVNGQLADPLKVVNKHQDKPKEPIDDSSEGKPLVGGLLPKTGEKVLEFIEAIGTIFIIVTGTLGIYTKMKNRKKLK